MLAFNFEETNVLRQALKQLNQETEIDNDLRHTIAAVPSVLVVFQDGSYFHRGKDHVDGLLIQPSNQSPTNQIHANYVSIVSLVDSSFFREQTRSSRLIKDAAKKLMKIAPRDTHKFLSEFELIFGGNSVETGSYEELKICDILVHRFDAQTIAACNRQQVIGRFEKGVRHEEALIDRLERERIIVPAATIDEVMLLNFLQALANESLSPNWSLYDKNSMRFVVSPEIDGIRLVLKAMELFSLERVRTELLERKGAVWFNSPRRQSLSELAVRSQADLKLFDSVQSRLKELGIEETIKRIL